MQEEISTGVFFLIFGVGIFIISLLLLTGIIFNSEYESDGVRIFFGIFFALIACSLLILQAQTFYRHGIGD